MSNEPRFAGWNPFDDSHIKQDKYIEGDGTVPVIQDKGACVNDMEFFISEESMAQWIVDLINGDVDVRNGGDIDELRLEFYTWLDSKGEE
jgi:hypothetical protein